MLFGKPKLPEAERPPESGGDRKLIDAGKNQEALALTRELEKLDANAAGLAMSYFYIMGEGVAEDAKAAVRRRAEVSEVGRPERARVEAHGHCVHDGAGFCRGRGPAAPGVRAG